MNPSAAYQREIDRGQRQEDAAQRALLPVLDRIHAQLLARAEPAFAARFLARFRTQPPVRGLYLHGGVGRGKTFLIEAKLSTVHRSLASPKALSSGMSNGQAMSQILWSRAGAHAVVIFKDHANGFVEIWPGAYVGGVRNALRARLDELKCWRRFHVEHLATNLKDLFEGGIDDQFLL